MKKKEIKKYLEKIPFLEYLIPTMFGIIAIIAMFLSFRFGRILGRVLGRVLWG